MKNPRAKTIVERMYRVLGNMLQDQLVPLHSSKYVVKELTSAAAFALRATVHGVTKFSPAQLAFSKDMILRTHMEAYLKLV